MTCPPPSNIYNPALRASYKEVEETAANRLLELLPEELRGDYAPYLLHPDPELEAVVKAADKLDAYLKCVKERKAGNGNSQTAQVQAGRPPGQSSASTGILYSSITCPASN